ncbi:MAG TPA: GNAT family N-acetyltransferase [Syntrophales bacterium]|nr:GNAT family N-acetyltransferase [Syntrophales bacterium]
MEAAEVDDRYPVECEEWVTLRDGYTVFLRPIKHTDGPLLLNFFQQLSPETIYFRFLTHLKSLHPDLLRHYVEIDYETHFALTAVITEEGKESIIGTCRYIVKNKADHAELTIVLRNDWQRRGLGKIMAQKVVDLARSKGISGIEILFDYRNEGMIRLFSSLGYPVKYESSILDIADRMEIFLKEITL